MSPGMTRASWQRRRRLNLARRRSEVVMWLCTVEVIKRRRWYGPVAGHLLTLNSKSSDQRRTAGGTYGPDFPRWEADLSQGTSAFHAAMSTDRLWLAARCYLESVADTWGTWLPNAALQSRNCRQIWRTQAGMPMIEQWQSVGVSGSTATRAASFSRALKSPRHSAQRTVPPVPRELCVRRIDSVLAFLGRSWG